MNTLFTLFLLVSSATIVVESNAVKYGAFVKLLCNGEIYNEATLELYGVKDGVYDLLEKKSSEPNGFNMIQHEFPNGQPDVDKLSLTIKHKCGQTEEVSLNKTVTEQFTGNTGTTVYLGDVKLDQQDQQ